MSRYGILVIGVVFEKQYYSYKFQEFTTKKASRLKGWLFD